jgi:hypothetical protein
MTVEDLDSAVVLEDNVLVGEPEIATLPANVCVLRTHAAQNRFSEVQTFYVLGTAHVSTASCADVVKIIEAVKPQVTDQYCSGNTLQSC